MRSKSQIPLSILKFNWNFGLDLGLFILTGILRLAMNWEYCFAILAEESRFQKDPIWNFLILNEVCKFLCFITK